MKTVLWLIAVLASGAIGFYLGIGHGAKTLGMIVAQNDIAKELTHVRNSLEALDKNDLVHSNRIQERNLASALFQIGSIPPGQIAHWTCTDKDRMTIQAARNTSKPSPAYSTRRPIRSRCRAWRSAARKPAGKHAGLDIHPTRFRARGHAP